LRLRLRQLVDAACVAANCDRDLAAYGDNDGDFNGYIHAAVGSHRYRELDADCNFNGYRNP